MAFVTNLDASADNRRIAERRSVNSVFAAWAGRGGQFTVIVHNISETGFRAEFSSELQVGDEVRLQLGKGAGYVSAEVVWRDGWDHGCRFLTPISSDEVRAAVETLTQVVGTDSDESAATPLDGLLSKPKPKSSKLRWMLVIVAAVVLAEGYFLVRWLL
jgi:hypothetical protein